MTTRPAPDLSFTLNQFAVPPGPYFFEAVTAGLLNRSYAVRNQQHQPVYFLQQINKEIFDVPAVMHNIRVVTEHLQALPAPPAHLRLVNTRTGRPCWQTEGGDFWRLYGYVAGQTYTHTHDLGLTAEAGRLAGTFLAALHNLPAGRLHHTIPRFHDIYWRYEQFCDSLQAAPTGRLQQSRALIAVVEKNIGKQKELYDQIAATCMLRATHNDTKLSNMLFDRQGRGICLVDYDTLMPGYWPLDYADAIRSICSLTAEDDPLPQKAGFSLSQIRAFTRSFLQPLSPFITPAERSVLAAAVLYMPFLMGLRMLTDYLNKDVYYRTHHPRHNLHRAQNQLALYQKGVALLPQIAEIAR